MRDLLWKPDWAEARDAFVSWWRHEGLAPSLNAPKDEPWEVADEPPEGLDAPGRWEDLDLWTRITLFQETTTFHGGTAFPQFNAMIGGPGSLALFMGAQGRPAPDTLWYRPCIEELDGHPPLELDVENAWWTRHVELFRTAKRMNGGRYAVSMPDLIENMDTLAQLRGTEATLIDILERPAEVEKRLWEINQAFFDCFDAFWEMIRDPWGGNSFCAFEIWGPGKTAKIQCDLSCMISEETFRRLIVPPLREQCGWLDYSMYHLDGAKALHQLPSLLAVDELDAIEFTPESGTAQGGDPRWYDLYREIKANGKSVQAVGVTSEEVEPLIDAVGAEGLCIMASVESESQARELLRRVGWKGAA